MYRDQIRFPNGKVSAARGAEPGEGDDVLSARGMRQVNATSTCYNADNYRCMTAVTHANGITALARSFSVPLLTGTKGRAPNIIDFPSYRVILRSLSEQHYGPAARPRDTNGVSCHGNPFIPHCCAKLLDKLIKLAINLAILARRA